MLYREEGPLYAVEARLLGKYLCLDIRAKQSNSTFFWQLWGILGKQPTEVEWAPTQESELTVSLIWTSS